MDVESNLYTLCKSRGITLFTVSHRTSLFKHHNYLLRFDGEVTFQNNPKFIFYLGKLEIRRTEQSLTIISLFKDHEIKLKNYHLFSPPPSSTIQNK